MKLVPFSKEYLRVDLSLPFSLRDETGQLLLAANQSIASEQQLANLASQGLFTGEQEAADWRRRVAEKVNGLLIGGANLNAIAQALPDQKAAPVVRDDPGEPFEVQIDTLVLQLDALLRQVSPEGDWPARFAPVSDKLRELTQRRFNSAVYLLIQHASQSLERYSAHHAVLVAAVAAETARMLQWDDTDVARLFSACLSMNVAMTREQDILLMQAGALSPAQRDTVREHAVRGAMLLKSAGVTDMVWLDAVARHHQAEPLLPLTQRSPGQRVASVIRRVDIFGAKLSRRVARTPMSPIQAAREACLGPDGKPDDIGGAILRAVGLYPPGSFVQLESEELAVVIARGRRANLPIVASLVGRAGLALGELAVRDTVDKRHAVKSAVLPGTVKVTPPHGRLLEIIRLKEQARTADWAVGLP
ncbi:MAG: hypothetical protein H6933_10440 [Burkholderiaceae bacterium]|nr:hypothetical protein [Rhodoferax sp.]MCP5285309.1 hypothetical protein [Burkholderiaceae bacterium]